jgi:hypothetical protein
MDNAKPSHDAHRVPGQLNGIVVNWLEKVTDERYRLAK